MARYFSAAVHPAQRKAAGLEKSICPECYAAQSAVDTDWTFERVGYREYVCPKCGILYQETYERDGPLDEGTPANLRPVSVLGREGKMVDNPKVEYKKIRGSVYLLGLSGTPEKLVLFSAVHPAQRGAAEPETEGYYVVWHCETCGASASYEVQVEEGREGLHMVKGQASGILSVNELPCCDNPNWKIQLFGNKQRSIFVKMRGYSAAIHERQRRAAFVPSKDPNPYKLNTYLLPKKEYTEACSNCLRPAHPKNRCDYCNAFYCDHHGYEYMTMCTGCKSPYCDDHLSACPSCGGMMCPDCLPEDMHGCDGMVAYSAAVHRAQRDALEPAMVGKVINHIGDLRVGDLIEDIDETSPKVQYGIIVGLPSKIDGFNAIWGGDIINLELEVMNSDILSENCALIYFEPKRFKLLDRGLLTRKAAKYSAAVHERQREAAGLSGSMYLWNKTVRVGDFVELQHSGKGKWPDSSNYGVIAWLGPLELRDMIDAKLEDLAGLGRDDYAGVGSDDTLWARWHHMPDVALAKAESGFDDPLNFKADLSIENAYGHDVVGLKILKHDIPVPKVGGYLSRQAFYSATVHERQKRGLGLVADCLVCGRQVKDEEGSDAIHYCWRCWPRKTYCETCWDEVRVPCDICGETMCPECFEKDKAEHEAEFESYSAAVHKAQRAAVKQVSFIDQPSIRRSVLSGDGKHHVAELSFTDLLAENRNYWHFARDVAAALYEAGAGYDDSDYQSDYICEYTALDRLLLRRQFAEPMKYWVDCACSGPRVQKFTGSELPDEGKFVTCSRCGGSATLVALVNDETAYSAAIHERQREAAECFRSIEWEELKVGDLVRIYYDSTFSPEDEGVKYSVIREIKEAGPVLLWRGSIVEAVDWYRWRGHKDEEWANCTWKSLKETCHDLTLIERPVRFNRYSAAGGQKMYDAPGKRAEAYSAAIHSRQRPAVDVKLDDGVHLFISDARNRMHDYVFPNGYSVLVWAEADCYRVEFYDENGTAIELLDLGNTIEVPDWDKAVSIVRQVRDLPPEGSFYSAIHERQRDAVSPPSRLRVGDLAYIVNHGYHYLVVVTGLDAIHITGPYRGVHKASDGWSAEERARMLLEEYNEKVASGPPFKAIIGTFDRSGLQYSIASVSPGAPEGHWTKVDIETFLDRSDVSFELGVIDKMDPDRQSYSAAVHERQRSAVELLFDPEKFLTKKGPHPTYVGNVEMVYEFPNGYIASVIHTMYSGGGVSGLWEIGVMTDSGLGRDWAELDFVDNGIIAGLPWEDVIKYLERIYLLPPYKGVSYSAIHKSQRDALTPPPVAGRIINDIEELEIGDIVENTRYTSQDMKYGRVYGLEPNRVLMWASDSFEVAKDIKQPPGTMRHNAQLIFEPGRFKLIERAAKSAYSAAVHKAQQSAVVAVPEKKRLVLKCDKCGWTIYQDDNFKVGNSCSVVGCLGHLYEETLVGTVLPAKYSAAIHIAQREAVSQDIDPFIIETYELGFGENQWIYKYEFPNGYIVDLVANDEDDYAVTVRREAVDGWVEDTSFMPSTEARHIPTYREAVSLIRRVRDAPAAAAQNSEDAPGKRAAGYSAAVHSRQKAAVGQKVDYDSIQPGDLLHTRNSGGSDFMVFVMDIRESGLIEGYYRQLYTGSEVEADVRELMNAYNSFAVGKDWKWYGGTGGFDRDEVFEIVDHLLPQSRKMPKRDIDRWPKLRVEDVLSRPKVRVVIERLKAAKKYAAAIHERQRAAVEPVSIEGKWDVLSTRDYMSYWDRSVCPKCGGRIILLRWPLIRRPFCTPEDHIEELVMTSKLGFRAHLYTRCDLDGCGAVFREVWEGNKRGRGIHLTDLNEIEGRVVAEGGKYITSAPERGVAYSAVHDRQKAALEPRWDGRRCFACGKHRYCDYMKNGKSNLCCSCFERSREGLGFTDKQAGRQFCLVCEKIKLLGWGR